MKKLLLFFYLTIPIGLTAQEMVYKPVNPAFGGDTFNYQWLLSSAEAQNSHTENSGARVERSDIDTFTESLNRQLLNRITSNLFRDQFGTDGELTEGTYMFGSLVLEVSPTTDGLLINILDTQTGDQTQIIIPN